MKLVIQIACSLALAPLLTGQTPSPGYRGSALFASDAADSDLFGGALSVSGNHLVIGAEGESDDEGAAYVFERDAAGVWHEAAKLTAPVPMTFHKFGHSVAMSGDRALIGALDLASEPPVDGSVYVFERIAGTWTFVQDVTISIASWTEAVETVVHLDGDRAVVGTIVIGDYSFGDSAAYVLDRDGGGTWSVTQELIGPDPDPEEWFGSAVRVEGDRAIVGALADDLSGLPAGAVHVFERQPGGEWTWADSLLPPAPTFNTQFGIDIDLGEDRILVGASRDRGTGAAYVYDRQPGGTWLRSDPLLPPSGATIGFGGSVALSGRRALVGGPASLNLFTRGSNGAWSRLGPPTGSMPPNFGPFGSPVDLDGLTAAIGAPFDDTAGGNAGSVLATRAGGTFRSGPPRQSF